VGAKAEIYALMHELAGKGAAILMTSSGMPELLRMSDRIIVMREGRKVGELSRAEANEERVVALATGADTCRRVTSAPRVSRRRCRGQAARPNSSISSANGRSSESWPPC